MAPMRHAGDQLRRVGPHGMVIGFWGSATLGKYVASGITFATHDCNQNGYCALWACSGYRVGRQTFQPGPLRFVSVTDHGS